MTSPMTLNQHKNKKLRHNRKFEECSIMGKLINRIPAGYRRLYLCDRFFEQKMADVVGCTTPEGEICEVNTYFVYLT